MTEATSSKSVPDDEALRLIGSVPAWYHRIAVRPGIVTPGTTDAASVLDRLHLPTDCSGLRAIDIGARDGFFSFELERRGAEVVAVDYMPRQGTGFDVAARLLGSSVEYRQENFYRLRSAELGKFDLVLCLGILYHLPDFLGALRIARDLCRGRLYLETLALEQPVRADGVADVPILQYFPMRERANDRTNFWAPNLRCVVDMLEDSEFRILRSEQQGDRVLVVAAVVDDPDRRYYWNIATGVDYPA
jgi:tRNA (mo5U34)-methyltransferase